MAGARRECHEEVGRLPRNVEALGTLYPSPGFLTETMTFFRATSFEESPPAAEQDEDELLEPRTFSLSELKDLLARGEINDMKTLAGLALVLGVGAGR